MDGVSPLFKVSYLYCNIAPLLDIFELHDGLPFQSGPRPENLPRFAVSDGGLNFVDGKLEKADLQYIGKANRARAFADSYSKVSQQM